MRGGAVFFRGIPRGGAFFYQPIHRGGAFFFRPILRGGAIFLRGIRHNVANFGYMNRPIVCILFYEKQLAY